MDRSPVWSSRCPYCAQRVVLGRAVVEVKVFEPREVPAGQADRLGWAFSREREAFVPVVPGDGPAMVVVEHRCPAGPTSMLDRKVDSLRLGWGWDRKSAPAPRATPPPPPVPVCPACHCARSTAGGCLCD